MVLVCNTLSAVSYMVRITDIPKMSLAKKIVSNGEIMVYLMVPLSVPTQKLYNLLLGKLKHKDDDDDRKKCE